MNNKVSPPQFRKHNCNSQTESKCFQNSMSPKGLVSRRWTLFPFQLDCFKWSKDFSRLTTVHRGNQNSKFLQEWRGAQHRQLLRKCKGKPQETALLPVSIAKERTDEERWFVPNGTLRGNEPTTDTTPEMLLRALSDVEEARHDILPTGGLHVREMLRGDTCGRKQSVGCPEVE